MTADPVIKATLPDAEDMLLSNSDSDPQRCIGIGGVYVRLKKNLKVILLLLPDLEIVAKWISTWQFFSDSPVKFDFVSIGTSTITTKHRNYY